MSEKDMTRQAVMQNIKKYRERIGLSQRQLADKLGFDASTVAYWETGRGAPNADTIVELCTLFGVKPSVMMGVEKDFNDMQEKAAKFYALYLVASPEVRLAVDSLLGYKE